MGEAAEIFVDPSDLTEDQLSELKWFDYRVLTPELATELFTTAYGVIFREFYGKVVDYATVGHAQPFPKGVAEELHYLNQARQAADSIGCRYDFYLRAAFWRFVNRGFADLPRPNQLYAEEVILDVRDVWTAQKNAELQLAKHHTFTVDNHTGSALQLAYCDYLIDQIKRRALPHLALATVVFTRRQLPFDFALQHFGPEILKRAELWSL